MYRSHTRLHSKFGHLILHVQELFAQIIVSCGLLGQDARPITLALRQGILETLGLLGGLIAYLLQPVIKAFEKAQLGKDVILDLEIVRLHFANSFAQLANL